MKAKLAPMRFAATAMATALAVGVLAPAAHAAPKESWPLVVTEIAPDNEGHDHFEYFEVTNTTDASVTVGEGGFSFAYSYADSSDSSRDVPLTVADSTEIPAGGTVVFWLSYANGTVDSFAHSEEEFRSFWEQRGGTGDEYEVVRVEGQAGMANGGDRGIRVLDAAGEAVSWSHYPSGSVSVDRVAQFRIPADEQERSMEVLEPNAAPTPGQIAATQLEERDSDPTDPTDPEEPTEPVPGPDPDSLVGNLLVTELMVDTANVGGSDGYEFIEIYNTTTEPIEFGDYQIRYLYPDNGNTALWPAQPEDATIQPGGTLLFWIKNGANNDLTTQDFIDYWGGSIGDAEVLEIFAGGMANGSARGIEVMTDTGATVSQALYNMNGARDVAVDQGLVYGVNPEDFGAQTLLGARGATPGIVDADQVPTELTAMTPDGESPSVHDETQASIDPEQDFGIVATITDNVLVRSVTLQVRSDLDENFSDVNLLAQDGDIYSHTIPLVDLIGKAHFEYRFVVSDGTNRVVTDTVRIAVEGVDTSPVRLSVNDGDLLSGTTVVSAAGDNYPADITLSIDGEPVSPTTPQLEREPVFAVEVTATDDFFRNGIVLPGPGETVNDTCVSGEALTIFDQGTYSAVETVTAQVPLGAVAPGDDLTLLVSAGTKAWPCEDDNENNDDFTISNPRLILSDGRTLTPEGYNGGNIAMGDSNDGQYDNYPAVFTIPDDAFTALGYEWDTTKVQDGEHTVSATEGDESASAAVIVDNTAPEVDLQVSATSSGEAGLQGEITLDAQTSDATSDVEDVTATLDGEPITLPYDTSSVLLNAGEHTFTVVATDSAGNTTEAEEVFTTPDENPEVTLTSPADGAAVQGPHLELEAHVTDSAGDDLDVAFYGAYAYDETDAEVTVRTGTVRDALAADRDGTEVGEGEPISVTSSDALPYQLFDVEVPEDADEDASIRVSWDGSANESAKVLMYAWHPENDAWVEVDRHVTATAENFTLNANVPAAQHEVDGSVRFLVQHSEGFAGENLSDRSTAVNPAHPDDTPRGEYDFTLAVESDTQYYNEEFYEHQLNIHEYLLQQREDINLQYLFHSGDIVDNHDEPYQWENADNAYRMLDDADLPYGVLAGNHDVGNFANDYGAYGEFFGEQRFAHQPWYGESYENNRGHFDLFSAGGIDFIVVHMGWGIGDEQINWMNDVLEQYPERVGIINVHEYLLTTGGLGPVPQRIQNEVVATNSNVSMVLSGHYHDAYTRYDEFDDDGDGVADRTVTQMLFDYQGLPEGGQGFLRLWQFDNEDEEIQIRTYSPSLEQYNSDHPTLDLEHQEFTISYETAGIVPRDKELHGEGFSAEILTGTEIGDAEAIEALTAVPSGSDVSVQWTPEDGSYGWYVEARDAHGGAVQSEVWQVSYTWDETATEEPSEEPSEDPGDGDEDGSDGPGDGSDGPQDEGDGLPRTGSPVALWAVILALALLGAGAVLSRRVRMRDSR